MYPVYYPDSSNSHKQTCKKYKITPTQYAELLTAQRGLCAICRRPPAKRKLAVDHDHNTGLVRGLLCFYCNKYSVGRHDYISARAMFRYLSKPPANPILYKRP